MGPKLQVVRNIENYEQNSNSKIVTIGNFDGLHRGHKSIFSKLITEAKNKGGESVLISFAPHPAQVLRDNFKVDLIQNQNQFAKKLQEAGLSTLIIEEFTKDYSKLTANHFFNRIYEQLKFDKLIIGYDFKFGKDKLGNFEFLLGKSEELGFQLEKAKPFEINGLTISSSLIRKLLSEGQIAKANEYLDYQYTVSGVVVKGEGKGAQIGFPTLNLDCHNDLFLKLGVYETNVMVYGRVYKSITNFGRAPTLKDKNQAILEVHILNEDMQCYGQEVELSFLSFIRPEKKFSSVEDLIQQIKKDISVIH